MLPRARADCQHLSAFTFIGTFSEENFLFGKSLARQASDADRSNLVSAFSVGQHFAIIQLPARQSGSMQCNINCAIYSVLLTATYAATCTSALCQSVPQGDSARARMQIAQTPIGLALASVGWSVSAGKGWHVASSMHQSAARHSFRYNNNRCPQRAR